MGIEMRQVDLKKQAPSYSFWPPMNKAIKRNGHTLTHQKILISTQQPFVQDERFELPIKHILLSYRIHDFTYTQTISCSTL